MNRDQTLALWHQGKEAWQEWAMRLAEKRRALANTQDWSVDWYGEGQNQATKDWLVDATADFSEAALSEHADFSGVHFPGPVDFDGAHLGAAASFSSACFGGNFSAQGAEFLASNFSGVLFEGFANFDRAHFGADITFENARFLKSSDMEPCARFQRAQFSAHADFSGARFAGNANFAKAAFGATAFDRCEFNREAQFNKAEFNAALSFVKTRFTGANVDFGNAQFRGDVTFLEAHFGGSRSELMISGACAVNFGGANFEQEACFRKCWLVGESTFSNAEFKRLARFDSALFVMPASFVSTVFMQSVSMRDAEFVHDPDFTRARFLSDCDFGAVKFGRGARFYGTHFTSSANFAAAEFCGPVSFNDAVAEAKFSVECARCVTEPDFVGMQLAEPLALGKLVKIKPKRSWSRWFWRRARGENHGASRWANASTRNCVFGDRTPLAPDPVEPDIVDAPVIAIETRTTTAMPQAAAAPQVAVAESDNPALTAASCENIAEEAPMSPAAAAVPDGDASKDTPKVQPAPAVPRRKHRSTWRPALAWCLAIIVFAPLYLGQRPVSHAVGEPLRFGWLPPAESASVRLDAIVNAILSQFATGPCVTGNSDAIGEALFLSAKNALFFIPENDHTVRRTYGCLYGSEGAAPNIPMIVSILSLAQAALSAALLLTILFRLRESVTGG